MPTDLGGRVALVTGAARGIGRAVAVRLAMAGADVVLNDLRTGADLADATKEVAATGRRGLPLAADVGDPKAVGALVEAAVTHFGRIDILVNNAGIFRFMPFLELTTEAFEDVLRVDLLGAFHCSQAVARQMVAQGGPGRVVMISSVSAHIAQRNQAHYCAAKAGLELMAKTMAVELAPYDITVNCVAPGGPIITPHTRAATDLPGFAERVQRRVPLGRPGQPADVSGAVAFLASDEAAYVTGSVLVVDGGLILARD